MKINQKNKKIIFFIISIIFFIDFSSFFISVLSDQKSPIKDNVIGINDFLIIFGFFLLALVYLMMLNLSEKFRYKIFNIASILVKNKDRMHDQLNWSLLVGTIIFISILILLFCFSVAPGIYDFLLGR